MATILSRSGACLAAAMLLTMPACNPSPAPTIQRQGSAARTQAPSLHVVGHATLQGRVTYKSKDPPTVAKHKPTKDPDKFPAEVPGAGWYVDEPTQGIAYLLVFLRPPQGCKLPVAAEAQRLPVNSAGLPIDRVQIGSPKGQFQPRVVLLHLRQKLEIINNSDPPVKCDANLSGRNAYSQVFAPGDKAVWDLEPADKEPYRVTASVYTWKSGYVWKLTHPYAVLTDAEGRFELKHVPVLEGDQKLGLWIWHELLPGDHFKEVGPLELEVGKTVVKDLTIPEPQ